MKELCCIYLILSKLGSAYSMFVSTFYDMKEALGEDFVEPTVESFCTSLIREEDQHCRYLKQSLSYPAER